MICFSNALFLETTCASDRSSCLSLFSFVGWTYCPFANAVSLFGFCPLCRNKGENPLYKCFAD